MTRSIERAILFFCFFAAMVCMQAADLELYSEEKAVAVISDFCSLSEPPISVKETVARLHRTYPRRQSYSREEVDRILFGASKSDRRRPFEGRTKENKPADALWTNEVRLRLEQIDLVRGDGNNRFQALVATFGAQPWYSRKDVQMVMASGEPSTTVSSPLADGLIQRSPSTPSEVLKSGFQHLEIRQNWNDLLMQPTVAPESNGPRVAGDNVGATFSYSYNDLGQSNSWSIIGSALLPFDLSELGKKLAPHALRRLIIGPGVYINKISDTASGANNVDEMFYQLNVFSKWQIAATSGSAYFLQARGGLVYGTTTEQRGSLPGFEIEFEPQAFFGKNGEFPLALGFEQVALRNPLPIRSDGSDEDILTYQLRAYAHLEGGYIQNAPENWTSSGLGPFMRLGPVIEASFALPYVPYFTVLSGLAFSAKYSYMFTLEGSDEHNSLVSAAVSYPIFNNVTTGQKITLNLQYMNGGLLLTKQDVRFVTIGVGIVY